MFHRRELLVVSLAAVFSLGAGGLALAKEKAPPPPPAQLAPPPAGKGQVVFYRKPLFSLIPFNWYVREGGVEVCKMVAGTYCVAPTEPGTHTFEVHSEATDRLALEVDAGETYYVVGDISMGMIVNRPNISPAQKAQFDAISGALKVQAPEPPGAAAAPPAHAGS
jgi:hypothetical protein